MKFEAKVNYSHIDQQSGKEKKITESYIIPDAVNWTDAETQLTEQMAKITNATITKSIKISDIIDIVKSEGDFWYKVVIELQVIDKQKGKIKSIKEPILIQADGFKDAYEKAQEYCLEILVPVEITSIIKSSIVDILDDEFVAPVKVTAENWCDDQEDERDMEELEDAD